MVRKEKAIKKRLKGLRTALEAKQVFYDKLSPAEKTGITGMNTRKNIARNRIRITSLEWVLNE